MAVLLANLPMTTARFLGRVASAVLVAMPLVLAEAELLTGCSSDSSEANGGKLQSGLAGSWLVTRTLVTHVDGIPDGFQDQQLWSFSVSGSSATLSTTDGTVGGSWTGSSWLFETDYTDPRVGLPAHLKIEIIGVDPLGGTLENTLYDPTGYRPPTLEAFRLDGVRQ